MVYDEPSCQNHTRSKSLYQEESRLNAGTTFPIRGIHTPIALAIKIDTKAVILYLKAFALSRSSFSLS